MNFNFNSQPEYALHTSLAEEMIRLYGVLTKFLITEKINLDQTVFGDYSHMKSDSSKIYDIYMLPENTEDWEQGDFEFTGYGLINTHNISLFVAKSSFDGIADLGKITGNLIIFPNNKIMEITHVDPIVPGVNNLFTYKDQKTVYQLTCKPYDFKLINELDNQDISVDPDVPYDTLDTYFNELIEEYEEQEIEAEVTPQVDTTDNTVFPNVKEPKPIVDNTEKTAWGELDDDNDVFGEYE